MEKENQETLEEMVSRAFGTHYDLALPKFAEFEAGLKGKKDEFVLIYYTGEVPDMHRFGQGYTYRSETTFRLGVLDSEKLIWKDLDRGFSTITLPVSRYVEGEEFKEAIFNNIFSQDKAPGGMTPPALGYYLMSDMLRPLSLELGGPRHTTINEILIGDELVIGWLKGHVIGAQELYRKAAILLSKLILEPMGENDGPLPEGRDPIGW